MSIVLALALGMVIGIAGFVPLLIARRLSVHRRASVREHAIPIGLACVFASLAILLATLFVAAQIAPEVFPFFGITLVIAFLAASGVFALRVIRGGGK